MVRRSAGGAIFFFQSLGCARSHAHMSFRLFLSFTLAMALCACASPGGKKAAGTQKKPDAPKTADATGNASFQAFLGRLRTAAATRDTQTMASMMMPDFGYELDPPKQGEGVFQYWDEKGLWAELQAVLKERFVSHGQDYMVAPLQFAMDPDYHGYRAGIRNVGGSWKFAYFVTD
jgi:hypothetical protein